MYSPPFQYPSFVFVTAAFGISYLIGVPFLIAIGPVASQLQPLVGTYLPRLLVVTGPGLAALLVAARTGGAPRVRRLGAALRPEGRHGAWWIGLPVVGALMAIGAFFLAGAPLATLRQVLSEEGGGLAAHFALQLGLIGMGEELGWRGWLLPHLLQRRTRLGATALIAATWGVWHGPVLLSGLQVALPFAGLVVALSVLLNYVWSQVEGNIFVVALAHASVNAPVFFLEQLSYAGMLDATLVTGAWPWLAAGYGSLAGLVLGFRWRWWLTRPPRGRARRATGSRRSSGRHG